MPPRHPGPDRSPGRGRQSNPDNIPDACLILDDQNGTFHTTTSFPYRIPPFCVGVVFSFIIAPRIRVHKEGSRRKFAENEGQKKFPGAFFTDTGEKSACLDGLQGGDLYSLVGGVVAGAKADSHREQHRSQQQPGAGQHRPGEGLCADDGGDSGRVQTGRGRRRG